MSDTGHIPIRQCVGCGRRRPKGQLRRFVVLHGIDGRGELHRDERGTAPGRGIYVCPSRACFDSAVARRAFARAARYRGGALAIDDSLGDASD